MSFYYSCKKCGVSLDLEAEIPDLLCPGCQEPMTVGAPVPPEAVATAAPEAPSAPEASATPAIKVAKVVSASAAMTGRKANFAAPAAASSTTGRLKTATVTGASTSTGRPLISQGGASSSSVRVAAGQEADATINRARAEAASILQNARSQAQMILDETQRQAAHMRSAAEAESADLRRVAEAQAGMAAGGMIQHLREAADAQAAGIVAEAQAKADDVRRMLTQAQMDFDTQIAEKRRLAEAEITAMKDAAAASPAADASGTTPPATATPAEAKPAAAAAKPAAPVKGSAMKALADAETPGLSDADRAAFQKRKSEMNDAAKREARMIMFCLITSFVGLLYTFGVLAMVQNKASGLVVISVLAIAADLGFLGYMGALIMKHYQQSKQAMANHQGRMAAARAVMSANPPSGPRAVIPKPAGKSTQGAKGGGKKPA